MSVLDRNISRVRIDCSAVASRVLHNLRIADPETQSALTSARDRIVPDRARPGT